MKIKTPEERKALRDGYCAGLKRIHVQENPYSINDRKYKIWMHGYAGIPDTGITDEGFIVSWVCFKCGKQLSVIRQDHSDVDLIWSKLMIGYNFCTECGDRSYLSLFIKEDKPGWSF